MPVIVLIELLEQPGSDAYQRLDALMQGTLGWETHLDGVNGTPAPLPRAAYAGYTELHLVDLANTLVSQIASDVWAQGARVLVLQRTAWAGSGTA